MIEQIDMFFSSNTIVSNILIGFVVLLLLYVARVPAHRTIRLFAVLLRNVLRLVGASLMVAEERVSRRNRQVMLASGRDLQERLLEREFQRVHLIVKRDLEDYPALNRVLSEQLTQIEEDYHKSIDVPPLPPTWLSAIESIAKIPATESSPVADILSDLNETLGKNHREAMKAYRDASRQRHSLLRRMVPYWRRLANTLSSVDRKISDLDGRIPAIDNHMQKYEHILAGTDHAERELSASFMTQFFVSGVVLFVALMGGVINFHLIALPMSEMVGGSSYLGPVKTADVAAMVIILVEIAMGIFLMESLRITRMFPTIHIMDDQMRRRMIVVTLTILVALASVESALAYMRDLLASDKEALTRSLSGAAGAGTVEYRWIASVGQMLLGFILPFALTCVAIPMESFIQSARVVFGSVLSALLRMVVFGLRWTGMLIAGMGSILIQFYDVMIFLPLWVERLVRQRHELSDSTPQTSTDVSTRNSTAAGQNPISRFQLNQGNSVERRPAARSTWTEPVREEKPVRQTSTEVRKKPAPTERPVAKQEDDPFGLPESPPSPLFR